MCRAGTIDELDLLLTSGRLAAESRDIILSAYQETMATSASNALSLAQKLIVSSAEFHSSNRFLLMDERAPKPSTAGASHYGYKAVIVLYMGGGADTFNREPLRHSLLS